MPQSLSQCLIRALPLLLALALLTFAFVRAVEVSGDLDWPPEEDFFRDMGAAESLAAGDWFADPSYLGEWRWYNPLTPGVLAALQRCTGIPLPLLYARAGPYLNLLGPLAFFLLIAQLVDRWSALAALTAYLFVNDPAAPSWFCATYSPWLWPCHFTQGLTYIALLGCWGALCQPTLGRNLLAGILVGVTALSHMGPAVLLALLITVLSLARAWRDSSRRWRWVSQWLVIGTTAFVVALPFLGPLLLVYGGRTLNSVGTEFAPLSLSRLGWSYLTLRTAVAFLGLAVVWGVRPRNTAAGYLLAWGAVAAVLLGYAALAQALKLPRLVPLFHFQIMLKAAEAAFFGVGLVALANMVAAHFARVPAPWGEPFRRAELTLAVAHPWAAPLLLGAVVGITTLSLPGYLAWLDHHHYRREAQRLGGDTEVIQLYDWVGEATDRTDVFLADPELSLAGVTAAGRKVVCMHAIFSSPFVDFDRRDQDCRALYAALRQGQYNNFAALARTYQVTFVVAWDSDRAREWRLTARERTLLDRSQLFELVYQRGTISVYHWRAAH